ncbi:MAG: 50S ribosomal protein L11 methyltransferase [Anaerolineales bacterium]
MSPDNANVSNSWLEISLVVNGEMAEAVAEVLSRYVQNGVVIQNLDVSDNPYESEQLTGLLRVSGYLPIDSQSEQIRRRIEEALWHLGQIQPLPEPEFNIIPEKDWMEAWKQHYRPIHVGRRLLVLPAWIDNPDPGRIPIFIDPGMAFGTGVHPTTQLSLRLIEKHIRPGGAVFDVGCGSGILSIAAYKLGASPVCGVDVDLKAVEIARENAAANGILEGVSFHLGSLVEIEVGLFPVRQAPLVVANILTHILLDLLDRGLAGLVAENGVLLLAGILQDQQHEILAAVKNHGLAVIDRIQMDDWLAFAALKS